MRLPLELLTERHTKYVFEMFTFFSYIKIFYLAIFTLPTISPISEIPILETATTEQTQTDTIRWFLVENGTDQEKSSKNIC